MFFQFKAFLNIRPESSLILFALMYGTLRESFGFQPVIEGKHEYNNRSSKWLPFAVLVAKEPCNSTDSHEIGTCYTRAQCERARGSPKGKCASGFGVCCVFVASCFDIISQNNTYFRSKGFPDLFSPNEYQVCTTKIKKPNPNVCQVLLTFHDMELNKGNEHGHCLVDRIDFFGETNVQLPHLCGPLTHQHLYLGFDRGNKITFSIYTDGTQISNPRKWNAQVTYINCDDPYRAPSGCLQYFTGSTGSLRILGYPENPHLAGLKYTICIRKERAAESIFWFPCRTVPFEKTFHLQGPSIVDTGFGIIWEICLGDYIVIMSDDTSNVNQNVPADRYCGNRLNAMPPFYINSKATPYIVVVRTDLMEDESERENSGFCLEWYQTIWRPTLTADGEVPEVMPPGGGEGP